MNACSMVVLPTCLMEKVVGMQKLWVQVFVPSLTPEPLGETLTIFVVNDVAAYSTSINELSTNLGKHQLSRSFGLLRCSFP